MGAKSESSNQFRHVVPVLNEILGSSPEGAFFCCAFSDSLSSPAAPE